MSTEAATAPGPAAPVDSGAVPAAPTEQPGHKVFAGNLAYSTTDDGLKAFFAPVASDILSTQIIYRGHRSAGYGFVAFSTLEAAQKAAELLNKKELDGRTVIVEIAKPAEEKQKEKSEKKSAKKRATKKVKAAAAAVADAITPAKDGADAEKTEGGEAAKPKKKRNTRKTKKAKAATEGDAAAPADGAAAATPAAPKEKKEKKPKVPRQPKPTRAPGEAPSGEPSKTMLFVANLGFTVDDAALSALFTDAGIPVTSARVVRRRWGQPRRSKGYGFVDVGSEEQQKKALETLQGKEVGGREIVLKIAVDSDIKKADEEAKAAATDAPAAVTATA